MFMKLLFFSDDSAEVEQACWDLVQSGIACEVRHGPVAQSGSPHCPGAELWITNEQDAHRALVRCVALRIGFSRRANHDPVPEELE
jgi:hypothetical protein